MERGAVNRRLWPQLALTQKAKAAMEARAVDAPSVDRQTAAIVVIVHAARAVARAVAEMVEDVPASDAGRAVRRI